MVRLVIVGHEGFEKPIARINSVVIIEDMQLLLGAIQAHDGVRLAHAEMSGLEKNGRQHISRRWITNSHHAILSDTEQPTGLALDDCVVLSANIINIDIRVMLVCNCILNCYVNFRKSRFHADANFNDAIFNSGSDFSSADFRDYAGFAATVFRARTSFSMANFHAVAEFSDAAFQEEAVFFRSTFHASADYNGATFHEEATFDSAIFHAKSALSCVYFLANASFERTKFYANAVFDSTIFHATAMFQDSIFSAATTLSYTIFKGDAIFESSVFSSDVLFDGTAFHGDVVFDTIQLSSRYNLYFDNARARQNVSFNRNLHGKPSLIDGKLFFANMTIDERLTFHGAQFGAGARLSFNHCLPRGGATIELELAQLGDRRSFHIPGKFDSLLQWLGFRGNDPLIEGEDSAYPAALQQAADDYELLAANFARMPATHDEEDLCRWRAHELRRHKKLIEHYRGFLLGVAAIVWAFEMCFGLVEVGINEYKQRMKFPVLALPALILESILYRWLLMRTMLGYMLQIHRIVVSGLVLMLGCAALFGIFASDELVMANGGNMPVSEFNFGQRVMFAFFFSLTTFVTLGYGDYAPMGWFKLVTGLEALLGVTLLALFTVAWGRKMIR